MINLNSAPFPLPTVWTTTELSWHVETVCPAQPMWWVCISVCGPDFLCCASVLIHLKPITRLLQQSPSQKWQWSWCGREWKQWQPFALVLVFPGSAKPALCWPDVSITAVMMDTISVELRQEYLVVDWHPLSLGCDFKAFELNVSGSFSGLVTAYPTEFNILTRLLLTGEGYEVYTVYECK